MPQKMTAEQLDDLATRFDGHRPKLQAIARRTLGSPWSADDAVQEAWVRLQRADVARIENLEAWLTTVVSRICIDLIRQRESRREVLADSDPIGGEPAAAVTGPVDPAEQTLALADLTLAMQVVLDTLGPLERLALVLHDVFALPYDEIAPIVERTPATARQLASRARARLRSVDVAAVRDRRSSAIGAFLAAARQGDFGGLLLLLDPDIRLRSDDAAVALSRGAVAAGAPPLATEVRGGDAVARLFDGRAQRTRPVLVDGVPAAAYVSEGVAHAVYLVSVVDDRIVGLDVIADPGRLATLDIVIALDPS
ncbi:sigma-70 family RNA polymerase sigma factor [Propionibacteriaceae bacterium Y2011]